MECPGDRVLNLPDIDEKALASAADTHKALSDETRLKILAYLQAGELCVCEIVDALGKPQSTVSHHLLLLQNAGLIRGRKQGRWIMYSINDDSFDPHSVFLRSVD
jgi:ArsR family transcriptional regulator